MAFFNEYYVDRDRWNSQVAENSARGAWSWGTVHTKGWGEVILDEPIMFGLTYVDEPTVAYGFVLDDDDQLVDGRFPRCSGGVMRWVREGQFYVGAHVFICVATADPMMAAQAWVEASLAAGVLTPPDAFLDDPNYDITHDFTFQAIAIKNVAS